MGRSSARPAQQSLKPPEKANDPHRNRHHPPPVQRVAQDGADETIEHPDPSEIGEAIDVAVDMIERAGRVEKALTELIADLEVRARWDREASKGIVACGATVYRNAKAALEKSK